jgi:hypothetical protein
MRYAYVENGIIVEGPKGVPKSWRNTSGFNLLPQEELIALGWLPWRLVEVPAPSSDWVMTTSTIEIRATEVVETQMYRQKTQSEKEEEARQQVENNRRFRQEAYREEADPLFFKSERGEATREEWLEKVTEIRNRFPTGE